MNTVNDEPQYKITINFNTVNICTWEEPRRNPDGTVDLIGMYKVTEHDYLTGAIVSEKIESTGLVLRF